MGKRIEPPASRGRDLYPDADPETLAWIVERARAIIDAGQGGAIGWEWGDGVADSELDPENNGPIARVFDATDGTVAIVTEGD